MAGVFLAKGLVLQDRTQALPPSAAGVFFKDNRKLYLMNLNFSLLHRGKVKMNIAWGCFIAICVGCAVDLLDEQAHAARGRVCSDVGRSERVSPRAPGSLDPGVFQTTGLGFRWERLA